MKSTGSVDFHSITGLDEDGLGGVVILILGAVLSECYVRKY